MVDKEVLMNDLMLLSTNFYKIIEVDLNTKNYFEVKVDNDRIYNDVCRWADAFVDSGGVHPEDVERFREFFNPFKLKEVAPQKWQRVYYRRMIGSEWRMVCMEVIPFENFSDEEPLVLLVVRDVEDYIKDFREQIS